MNKSPSRASTALTLLVLSLVAFSCGGKKAPAPGMLDLSGTWRLTEEWDTAPADPGYDDTRAGTVPLPGTWEHVLKKNDELAAVVWLRTRVVVPDGMRCRQLVLSLGTVALADEAYINGVYVGGTGVIPGKGMPLDYGFALHRERVYRFPAALVRFGDDNVVALRVFSHMVSGMGERPRLLTDSAWARENRLRDYVPSLNNLNPLILSLLLLIFLVIIVRGSGDRVVGLLALCFILGVSVINLLLLGLPRMHDNLLRFKLFYAFYAMVDYILLLLIQAFFGIRSRVLTAVMTILLGAAVLMVALSPDTRTLDRLGVNAVIILVICCIIAALSIFFIALARDPRRYWYLSLLVAFILASVSVNLHAIITRQMHTMSYSFALRLPAILLGAVFVYLFDLKNARRERDSLATALMKKTNELRGAKSLLSRVKVKPEPRDVIHDVIEHLDSHYHETYDRRGLAERFGLNEDYMGQVFKKVTGTNIASYINARRIEASLQLLRETDSRIIDIAFHVGFDNLTYFYRNFRKHRGVSPVEYRRRTRLDLGVMDLADGEDVY